ncbi:MAG: family acetyltransferase [Roseomonas sp.]|jgi:N-acetylglutamate synthase-like GNAT family acetyltransferase|nr:family acetyltransferase [Roseomonas sp.]
MIRRAMPSEAPALRALTERAYADYVPLLGRRPAPMDADYGAHIAAGEAWVLEEDGGLLGLLVLEEEPGHLWLDNIAVEPRLHHRGTGQRLLRFTMEEAARRDFSEVRLLTNERMARNIAIYARMGFVEYDRREENGFRRVYMRAPVR